MEQNILRHEVLKALDTGLPCNLVFISADRKRGTGGKVVEVKGWQKIVGDNNIMVRRPGQFKHLSKSKNPNHAEHKTINIYNPNKPTEHAMTVHWRLMVFFNGKRITQ